MKLCFVLILTAALHVSAKSYSQKKVTMKVANAGFERVLDLLEEKSGYSFLFNHKNVLENRKFSFDVKEASVFDVLDSMMNSSSLQYKLMDENLIVIYPGNNPVAEIELRGTVRDSTGMGLPGVTIKIRGTNKGTVTNESGHYVLTTPDDAVLIFTLVGYEAREMPLSKRKTLDMVLREVSSDLSGVVVVGFGKQRKTDVIGAVTTINPEDLKVPSSNLTTALAGRLAGVIAYQRNGEPGMDNADFFIRGVTTFGYKKNPLILIDGVELTTTDLARLQPDDIASFSILKDATATAIYGARGANGVILVTTKEGKDGKVNLSVRLENTISQPTKNIELADPITFMKLNNEAVTTRDPLAATPYSNQQIERTMSGVNPYMYPSTDWQKTLFKDFTTTQRANVSVSGGGTVARYYVAASYSLDNGILQVDKRNNFNSNIKLKNYSLRSNVNVNLTKTTELIIRLSGSFDDYKGPVDGGSELYNKVMNSNRVLFPAYYPIDDEHAYVKHIMFGNYNNGNLLNPYAELVSGYREYTRANIVAQLELKQDLKFITEGLSFRTMMNTTRTSYYDLAREYSPYYYTATTYDKLTNTYKLSLINESTATDWLEYREGRKDVTSVFYIESALMYNRSFSKHYVSALLVNIMRSRLAANAGSLQNSLPYRNVGLSGRATYAYDGRYFAEFNFGNNGSERFHKSHRFGFFPSAGAGWTISNERFFANFKRTFPLLKLRATYGLVGNDDIGEGRFLYLSNVNMTDGDRSATFGTDNTYTRSGISIGRYADPNITWEKAVKTNIGLELNWKDKVTINADYFTEHRKDILMDRNSIPAFMGLSSKPQTNYGQAKGRGVDVAITADHAFSKDFWVQGIGNFTYAASKYLVYEEPAYATEWWKSRIGYSLGQTWGYLAERLFVDEKEVANAPTQFGKYLGGDIKYKDVNGDGMITSLDEVPIGYPTTPEIVYGFGFSMKYKNFDLSTFFQGLARESFFISPSSTAPFIQHTPSGQSRLYERQLLKAYADDHWSEENRNLYALWPRLSATEISNNLQTSTWYMRNGAFLRLKQVELGYNFGTETMRRLHMKSLRIYVNGTNLARWSKFKLWDVEMGGNALNYPLQKTFNIGIRTSL